MNIYHEALLIKGEKKGFCNTEGQVLHKCFCRGEEHFSVTKFISQKPPLGWTAMNSKMSERKEKKWFPE